MMQELTLTETNGLPCSAPPDWYTLEEAASYLAVRADDLAALLPDTAIVVEAWPVLLLTQADLELLERLIQTIRAFYAESVYAGGEL